MRRDTIGIVVGGDFMGLLKRMRPEVLAGGYARNDGAVEFFGRVNAVLEPDFRVLDFGAGRGAPDDDECSFRRDLRVLKGKVAEIIGVDVDPAVAKNPILDGYRIITPGHPLPFDSGSFDLVLCEWVLEHLDDAEWFASEMHRVLRPGGWLCARTPNKWGLTALVARVTPNSLHKKLLRWIQPSRKNYDVFPTRYRLNTAIRIRELFNDSEWANASYVWYGDPKYHAGSEIVWRLTELWYWLMPKAGATDLFVFLKRRKI